MISILLQKANAAQQKANTTQQEADTTQQKADAAKLEAGIMQHKAKIMWQEANIAEQEGGTIQQKANTARQQADAAQQKANTAQQEAYAAKRQADTAQQQADTSQQEADTAKKEASDAMLKVKTAKRKTNTLQQEAEVAQQKAEAVQQKAESTQQEADTAKQEAQVAKVEADTANWGASTLQQEAEIAQERAEAAQQSAKTAKQKADTAQLEANAAQQKANTTQQEANALQEKADTAKRMANTTITQHKTVTAVYDLAIDCLRLSMHFFHPIQQCAQQVYHSALPLSPTSSHLHKSYLQSAIDGQLSYVTAFSGAPDAWGLVLRTINVRPRQVACIATSLQRIIAACKDTVNIYNAVTGVLQQSLQTPETATKIQGTPDGSVLFFAHVHSVTMWDVQTGGLIHTFTTQSKISDTAVSIEGVHIACGLFDGSVEFWDIHTKKKGKGFGNGQPVVTIHWLSPVELAVATQRSIYIHNISASKTLDSLPTTGPVWGMVYLVDGSKFLVGTSQPGEGAGQKLFTLDTIKYTDGHLDRQLGIYLEWKPPISVPLKQPTCLTLLGNELACITPPSGVVSFNTISYRWTNSPPPLDAVTSMTVSLNRNLVAQTKDSIQIFSPDVLKTGKARDDVQLCRIFPLGEKHIACLQPNRHLTLLELETLREIRPGDNTSLLESLLTDQSLSARVLVGRGLVAELGVPAVVHAWESGITVPEWAEAAGEDATLSGLSPNCTRVVTVYRSPRRELRVRDTDGTMLAKAPLEHHDLGTGEVYDLTFDSETRFYLKIDEPGRHIQIPCDIIPSPSGRYSYTITKGRQVSLSEPRAIPPYRLDGNCEWVLDTESRKICWIPPGNIQRSNGGYFWAGLSLVMVGDDGVVRKVSFKEPGC